MDSTADPNTLPINQLAIREQSYVNDIAPDPSEAKAPACITDLPIEIFNKIFKQLTRKQRLGHPESISRVCRYFRDMNRPFVYKSIHLKIGSTTGTYGGTRRRGVTNLAQFRREATLYKHLRDRVTFLTLEVSQHHWYEELATQFDGLSRFNNLRELCLNPPPFFDYGFNTNEVTKSLRLDFNYNRREFWNGSEVSRLCLPQYLRIDRIRKLQIEHISFVPEMHRPPFTSCPPRSSPIQELRFVDCSPQELGILPDTLLLIKELKAFMLETNLPISARNARGKPHTMTPVEIAAALQPHSGTLQEIAIAFSDAATFFNGPTIKLTNYISLTMLAIPEPFVVGLDGGRLVKVNGEDLFCALPYQLKELQLQYSLVYTTRRPENAIGGRQARSAQQEINSLTSRVARLKEFIEVLAIHKGNLLPNLHRVVWWHQIDEGAPRQADIEPLNFESTYQDLKASFKDVGVEFEFGVSSAFGDTPFGKRLGIMHRSNFGKQVSAPKAGGLYHDDANGCDF